VIVELICAAVASGAGVGLGGLLCRQAAEALRKTNQILEAESIRNAAVIRSLQALTDQVSLELTTERQKVNKLAIELSLYRARAKEPELYSVQPARWQK
jgi:hypothetical protein